MIVFDLECRDGGHRFEGWFGSSDDFASQQARGLVSCPQCLSADVLKAPMAPNLTRKGNQIAVRTPPVAAKQPAAEVTTTPPRTAPGAGVPAKIVPTKISPEAAAMMQAYARMQVEALKMSRWVGDTFAADARAMHYGEKDQALIHGQATAQEAHALLEEGIEIAPILFPSAPPSQLN